MPTRKETKNAELSKNEDLIISSFFFCLCFVSFFFFILSHPRKLWPKLACKSALFAFLAYV